MQGFELSLSNIHSISELLECMKGLVLQIQNFRISMTQGNNRIFKRSPSEVPVLIIQQKLEASYQINESLQRTFASKEVWTKGYTVVYTVTHYSFHNQMFLSVLGDAVSVKRS